MTRLLTGAGLTFWVFAALVAVTGGVQTSIGPLPISATSASRVFFEGTVLLLLAECGAGLYGPRSRGQGFARHRLIAVIALFLIAGAADSETRRVGDGFEYLGMARTALMLGVCWLLARAGAGFVAVLFAAMLLSWVDKAHAEIFIAALTGGALLLRATAPAVALVLLGVAAAQMPVLIVLLVACAAESLLRGGARARIAAGVAAGLAIAALHPLYYLWRLGIASPLPDTVIAPAPTLLATIVWTRPPAFDNPLPEVFSERTAHIDGIAPMPVATVRCEKALIVATDAGVSWPPSCVPRAVPAECRTPGALCYANDARVVQAPGQPGFSR